MSDLISREKVIRRLDIVPLFLPNSEDGRFSLDETYRLIIEFMERRKEVIANEIPSADIMECARAIKEYCRDRDNLDEPCEDCPFHFYMGYKGHCRFKSFPSEWNLPEGEKGGAE